MGHWILYWAAYSSSILGVKDATGVIQIKPDSVMLYLHNDGYVKLPIIEQKKPVYTYSHRHRDTRRNSIYIMGVNDSTSLTMTIHQKKILLHIRSGKYHEWITYKRKRINTFQ